MSQLEKYDPKLPSMKKLNLAKALFQDISTENDEIELIISIKQTSLNIKELSSYLEFIYKCDALLSGLSIARYSHNPKQQIKIDEIRFGSWEIVIQRLINSTDANTLVTIFLALKFLPKIIGTFIDKTHTIYQILDTRESYLGKKEKEKRN